MDRSTVVFLVDSALIAAAALIVLLCIRAIFVSLRRRYVYINGKKATVDDEPIGFWLVIISWVVLSVLFSYPVAKWVNGLGLLT